MLKRCLILVCLASLLTVYQINAQDDFSIGPRVGLNFSNVSNLNNSESYTGYALGLTSTYSISQAAGLTMDLLYSHEGYAIGANETKLSYIQVPFYFDVFFGDLGESFRPKVYVGFVPGFLVGEKLNDIEQDNGLYNSFNFGFSGGLGFNARVVNRVWLNADLRANLGLTDIYNSDIVAEKVSMTTIQPSLGIAYGLSKVK